MRMGNKPSVSAGQLLQPSERLARDQEINNMRNTHIRALLFATLLLASVRGFTQEYAVGADVSFLAQAEQQGAVFKDANHAEPGLQILKDHGYRWIRLRLFHTPTDLPNNLRYTIALAKQAHGLGFRFLLDYHYADSWPIRENNPCPKRGKASRTRNWSKPSLNTAETQLLLFGKLACFPTWFRSATRSSTE